MHNGRRANVVEMVILRRSSLVEIREKQEKRKNGDGRRNEKGLFESVRRYIMYICIYVQGNE